MAVYCVSRERRGLDARIRAARGYEMATFTITTSETTYVFTTREDGKVDLYRMTATDLPARYATLDANEAREIWRDLLARGGRRRDGQPTCYKCDGSGRFYGKGYVENGVFKGHIGTCYACNGTGKQSATDLIRCDTYWKHYQVSAY